MCWLDVQRWWLLRGLLPSSLRSRWFLLVLLSGTALLLEHIVFFVALLGVASVGSTLLPIWFLGLMVILVVVMIVQSLTRQLNGEESASFSLLPGGLGLLWFARCVFRRMFPLAVSSITVGAVGETYGVIIGYPYCNGLGWTLGLAKGRTNKPAPGNRAGAGLRSGKLGPLWLFPPSSAVS
jgi:hypothetical protein